MSAVMLCDWSPRTTRGTCHSLAKGHPPKLNIALTLHIHVASTTVLSATIIMTPVHKKVRTKVVHILNSNMESRLCIPDDQ